MNDGTSVTLVSVLHQCGWIQLLSMWECDCVAALGATLTDWEGMQRYSGSMEGNQWNTS